MVAFSVRPDIDAAAEKLSSAFGAKREIQRLPGVLWEGETVELLATGVYGKGNGLLAMTNQRLVFYFHGVMSQKVEDFPYGRITSVQWSGGMLMGTLTVFASGNKAEIKQVPKDQGTALADLLRQRISGVPAAQPAASTPAAAQAQAQAPSPAPAPAAPAAPASGGQDVAARLQTLEQLRTQDLISDEEYTERRTRILDSL
ncbi:PH domain-containing protein [Streptomyces sp. ALI-76-A]|uniref:PH domain-containing protein n=1 Tax=Streptomyces sp. ALI-76-A TaxID=3025736 RepID=UPI00256EFAB1|nr:PH domain-containing protein [Streptomyces sp. ALI-76-A]MDL5202468.1 PH domain-containing protein [Streptomyces sp. ALI-76-A]